MYHSKTLKTLMENTVFSYPVFLIWVCMNWSLGVTCFNLCLHICDLLERRSIWGNHWSFFRVVYSCSTIAVLSRKLIRWRQRIFTLHVSCVVQVHIVVICKAHLSCSSVRGIPLNDMHYKSLVPRACRSCRIAQMLRGNL